MAQEFEGKVRFVSENYGDSKLAKRFGVTRYPAIFVDDVLAATPDDFGFYGKDAARAAAAPAPAATIAEWPAVTITDLDGRSVDRSTLAGRPVVVELWATWCPPCRGTLGWLGDLKKRYGDRLVVVAIAVQSEEPDVRKLVSELKLPFVFAIGTPELVRAFGDVSAVPTLLLFDGTGRAGPTYYGAPPTLHADAEAALAALLK